ncbi:MAG: hypothetical protein GX044_08540 [Firmicutes bacterium]|jgi:sugar diacid utilization regulator|nr:hypothetical protein [Bacillota bacterium]
MYVIDPSFRTLSYTKEVSCDAIDALWKSIVVEGHTDIATVNAMKENNALSWLNSCWEPIINTSPIFSSPRINANIMKGPEKIGTLIIIEAFTKLEKAHLHMAKHLVNVIFLAMQKEQVYRDTLFADLLKGKNIKKKLIEHQLRLLGWSIDDHYFVVKVKVDEHDLLNNTLEYTAQQLESCCEESRSRSIIFRKDIVLIINTGKLTEINQDCLSRLELFLAKSKLTAGISACCNDILEIRDYYLQASVTLELGAIFQQTASLLKYDNYVLYHLIHNAAQTMDLYKLCHPAVIRLLNYDQENGSNYYQTLRVYMNNDKNLVESAKALFIHRNTLVYRINKIMEIINLDLNNENIKSHLLISFVMIDYLKKNQKKAPAVHGIISPV